MKTFNSFEEFTKNSKIDETLAITEAYQEALRAIHFEIDPKKQEELKLAYGKSTGEVSAKKQIEAADYSLKKFRKEIKFGDGTYLGVFLPGSYDAAVSTLGDGPHKKAVAKVKWSQKKYDQWLEDVASNGGADNAFDMAQNAKNETGLIDWVKKEFRGDNPLQRIQWDIEAFAESVVIEGISVTDERVYGKKGIIIMIDDNGKQVSAIFKDKKNADKYNRNKAEDIKALLDLAKDTKYPNAIDESVVNEAKDMSFTDYLEVLDAKFEDAMAAVKGENGSDAEIKPTRGDILQNFTLFRNYISSLTKKYKGDKTKLRFLTECVNEYTGIINESVTNEAKNTIGLAFKEEQDYLDFKAFVTEQPRGTIRKNIGFDSKTKSWEVIMDVKVLDDIYGEGHPGNKESGWYGALPTDFESVIIEGFVSEAFIGPFVFNDTMSDEELKAMYDGALDGYANWQKGFQHPKAKYKQAYQEIEKLLKKRGVEESVVTEGRVANQWGIESQHIGKLQNGKMNKFTEGTGMPFGLISRPEGGLSDTDKNAVKDYVNADNIVLGFYPMEDSNNDTMYDAVKAEGVKVITDLVSKEYGLKLIETIKGKRHCAGDTCSLTHYLVFSKTNESVVNEHSSQDSRELNEGELNSKVAKKLTIGDTIKTDKHTYTITDFGQKANAFRQFQVEDEAGEIYQIQVSLYGSNRIGVGAGRSLNFRDEVLEALVTEKREDVGKYNTVKKVINKLGRRPSEQDLATFINNNYYDVTEVERGEDDPSANDKIADLVGFYKFDIEDWEIAWADAQNEAVVTEAKTAIRAEVMDFLETRLKLVRTSEEFDGAEGGIWTSAENGETLGGSKIFDYYSESSKYEFGVLNKFAKELSKLGWYCEFYDPGTVMIWEE